MVTREKRASQEEEKAKREEREIEIREEFMGKIGTLGVSRMPDMTRDLILTKKHVYCTSLLYL